MDSENKIWIRRIIIYTLLFVVLIFGYLISAYMIWQGSTELHTLMELVATLLALFVGILALLRFYTRKDDTFLFLGTGFLGAALLDGYHTLVTSSFFVQFFPSPPPTLIPWSEVASRIFLSVLMFVSWWGWKRQQKRGGIGKISEKKIYSVVSILTLASFLFIALAPYFVLFAFIPLPRAFSPNMIFGRPIEFVAAFFFLLALIGYARKGYWKRDHFEHWVILSIIFGFISQALYAPFSHDLFDTMYNTAHILKQASYICVLIGLFISMFFLFRQAEESSKILAAQNVALKKAKRATERALKTVEKEKQNVSREKDKTEAILYSIGDGVFVIDKNYRIRMFNRVAADISGYTIKEAAGKKYGEVLKFVYEKTGKVNDKFIKECMRTGEIKEMTNHTLLIRKNGEKVPVSDSAAPLKDKSGKVVGCVVVFRDITKEREIDRAKTEFVSLASHQLRTPLSTINWYAEMLLAGDAGKLKKDQEKYLQEVYTANQRMVDLVNALLNVSRIELGTFTVEPKSINLIDICRSVVNELKPQILEKKLRVEEKYDKNIPKIQADPKLVRIIFQNLLSNAVKYTPKGKVVVEITLKKEGNKGYVLIKVSDTGYGIPQSQQSKIFTKLYRADNVKEKDTEGTGLGLYIVKSIIDHTKGKIWFESEENKGTSFYVAIPLTGMKKKKGTKELS